MTTDLIIIFATATIPFIFFILDLTVRGILQMPLDDLGPDVTLIGVSLCLARMMEMVDTLVHPSPQVVNVNNLGSQFVIFILLFLGSLIIWLWCLGILHRKVGEKWKFIGGEDLPKMLAAFLGMAASTIVTIAYAVSRILT